MLHAFDLQKTYTLPHTRIPVLRGASLDVEKGGRVAIVGRSGAGKSTLLHVLGGLDRPDAGDVVIEGHPLYCGVSQRVRTARRAEKIGFVFQSYHLMPEMDVVENVMLPAMTGVIKRSTKEMRSRALELIEAVGLTVRATHTPMELSGGEQQRVALARALMNDPALILADEPTGNLDRLTGGQIMDLLFGLSRTKDLALVMVTHSMETASLCDRVFTLADGILTPTN